MLPKLCPSLRKLSVGTLKLCLLFAVCVKIIEPRYIYSSAEGRRLCLYPTLPRLFVCKITQKVMNGFR